ncbi:uncharacterized protein A4U43_C03F30840 [Asparagus officinalis]|uniref:Uncharacterized protein n=1 Tax=Asparagus officinalis TaxID=4686 RepID=A0A5P1FG31_ASPOF|nr:uncharacterized protein A4U43_C03F30840 [Asparagus officinalis]
MYRSRSRSPAVAAFHQKPYHCTLQLLECLDLPSYLGFGVLVFVGGLSFGLWWLQSQATESRSQRWSVAAEIAGAIAQELHDKEEAGEEDEAE